MSFPGSFRQKCEGIAAPLVIGHLPHRLPVRRLLAASSCPSSQEALCSLRAYPQSHYPGCIHFILGSFCCSAMLPGGQVFIFLFSIPPSPSIFLLAALWEMWWWGWNRRDKVCMCCVCVIGKKEALFFPLLAKILSVALPPFPFIAVSVKRRKKKSHEPNRLISQNTPEKYACCACNYLWEQGVFIIYIYIYIYKIFIYVHI